MDPQKYLKNLFQKTLEECSSSRAIKKAVQLENDQLIIDGYSSDLKDKPIYVLSVGKASIPMFESLKDILEGLVTQSLVITPDAEQAKSCQADAVIVGSHPVPDESSLEAGRSAISFLKNTPENALVMTLISGGTSSLMCLPGEDISISDLNKTFELLNNSGATIHEINTVRKHCSQIKGGQLLRYLKSNATLIDLVISDVPNDDLSIIGSGPTTPDASTYQDAYHILLEYELWEKLPDTVKTHMEKGITGEASETLKPNESVAIVHHSFIISSAKMFAQSIAELANKEGYKSWVADEAYNKDVQKVATDIVERISFLTGQEDGPSLYIFFGESTVDVTGNGKGGRNQELALRGAMEIAGRENVTWLSAGTDGIDGPTDAAGAIVDGQTIQKAREQGLDPQQYLQNNDSYHFHEKVGTLLKTGPTGNNLMDVVLVLVTE